MILLFLLFAVLVIALAGAALYAIRYKPKVADDTPFETSFDQFLTNEDDPVAEITTRYERVEIEDHTRKEDFYNFLLLGKDRAAFNTDVIMLISLDTSTGKATVMQIPRDTYIEVGDKSYKLNALYAAMYNKAKAGKSSNPYYDGMVGFVEAIQANLYIRIDYWAVISLQGFVNIVDMMGGVEVDVPFAMDYDDPYQNLSIHLQPGYQTLTGLQAESFVRFRSNYVQADIGRVNAQKIFLSAFLRKMKNAVSLKTIANVAKTVLDNCIAVSIGLDDSVYFAKQLMELDLSNLTMFTMPGADTRADGNAGAWYYVMNRADTLTLINAYFNVYERDITDAAFDSQLAFTDEERPHIDNIYRSEATLEDLSGFGMSAAEVNSQGIDIPLLN